MTSGERSGIQPIFLGGGDIKSFHSGGGSCVGFGPIEIGEQGQRRVPILDTKSRAAGLTDPRYAGLPSTETGNAIVGYVDVVTLAARTLLAHEDSRVRAADAGDHFRMLGAAVLGDEMAAYFDADELRAFAAGLEDGDFDEHLNLMEIKSGMLDLKDSTLGQLALAEDMQLPRRYTDPIARAVA
jgi:hypothetical protein